MRPMLAGALGALGVMGALLLTGCASSSNSSNSSSKSGLAAQVKQEVTESGEKRVSIQPHRVSCSNGQNGVQSTYQCPLIGADWTSKRSGIARLTVAVPGLAGGEVTGADFHLGASEVVRVKNKSAIQPESKEYPATAFDVPLTFVEKLAYGPRSWVRVYNGDQRFIDANISTGEDTGKAVESLAYFMKSVDETSGRAPSEAAKGGGLFERLGISDEGSSSSKGVEGMHLR